MHHQRAYATENSVIPMVYSSGRYMDIPHHMIEPMVMAPRKSVMALLILSCVVGLVVIGLSLS